MIGSCHVNIPSSQRKEPLGIAATRITCEFLEALFNLPGNIIDMQWRPQDRTLKIYYEDPDTLRSEGSEAVEYSLSLDVLRDFDAFFCRRAQEKNDKPEE